jgi:hypothetical protein
LRRLFNLNRKGAGPHPYLLLAHFGKDGRPETGVPKITQQMLAEIIGTTRSRVAIPCAEIHAR